MSDEPLYLGVAHSDGEWVAVAFAADGFDHADVFPEIGSVWAQYEEVAESILVDIPVGLQDDADGPRPPERAAREVLGPRADAVVDPPVREAARKRRYPAAARVTERKTGRQLSRAAFERSDAIVALDDLLQEVSEARPVFAEAHPEVCFRAFAGTTLEADPSTAGGYAERMRALATFDRDAPPVVQHAAEATTGHAVTVADVLDAVALGYTARPGPGSIRTLPADPTTDSTGLPMRLIYRAESPLTGDAT
jgi:predicted RNase H-like nuclease